MNAGLQKLGASRIESPTQNTPHARTMSAAYDRVLKAELRRYDWGFAIKRDSIAADAEQTVWGDWNRYALPNDFVRLIRDDETGQSVDWRIEGQFIVTADDAPLNIRYLAFIEDPNYYDSLFVDALAAKLAYETCQDITGSTGKQQQAKMDYDFAIAEARRLGAIEKPAQEFPEDDWLNARL